jgi:hypothetical protein
MIPPISPPLPSFTPPPSFSDVVKAVLVLIVVTGGTGSVMIQAFKCGHDIDVVALLGGVAAIGASAIGINLTPIFPQKREGE